MRIFIALLMLMPMRSQAQERASFCRGFLLGLGRLGITRMGADPLAPKADELAKLIENFVIEYPERNVLLGLDAPSWDDFEILKNKTTPLGDAAVELNPKDIPRLQQLLSQND